MALVAQKQNARNSRQNQSTHAQAYHRIQDEVVGRYGFFITHDISVAKMKSVLVIYRKTRPSR